MTKKLFTYSCSILLFCIFSVSSVYAEESDIRNSYAVVWSMDTDDAELFNSAIGDQSIKVLELWKSGIVENVYLDTKKTLKVIHKGDIARVMFFIKAKTDGEARKILDELPLVKKKVATYTLHPVGILWLKQF